MQHKNNFAIKTIASMLFCLLIVLMLPLKKLLAPSELADSSIDYDGGVVSEFEKDSGKLEFKSLTSFGNHNFSDSDFQNCTPRIARNEEIVSINLSYSSVTDRVFKHIALLPRLQSLSLSYTSVSCYGIENLQDSNIDFLYLTGISISNEGVVGLSKLTRLQILYIGQTGVSDKHIGILASLSKLHQLNLANTLITDAAIPLLLKLNGLQELNIAGTQISDDAIVSISKLNKLKSLNIFDTLITAEGKYKLQLLRPDLFIYDGK